MNPMDRVEIPDWQKQLLGIPMDAEDKDARSRWGQYGTILSRIIDRDRNHKKQALEAGSEVEKFARSPTNSFLWEFLPKINHRRLFGEKTMLSLANQYLRIIQPYLIQGEPRRTVSVAGQGTEQAFARARVEEDWLNYCAKHGRLKEQLRICSDDLLIFGTCVQWHGLDEDMGIVWSPADRVRNLLLDADATHLDDCRRVARPRLQPKWILKRQFPWASEIIDSMPAYTRSDDDIESEQSWETDRENDRVEYYEVFLKDGLHHYKDGVKASGFNKDTQVAEVPDRPLKYCVTRNGKLLGVNQWPAPFWTARKLPCSICVPYKMTGTAWGDVPLRNAIPHMRALNYAYLTGLSRFQIDARLVLAFAEQNGVEINADDLNSIMDLDNTPVPVIKIKTGNFGSDNPVRITDLIQKFQLGTGDFIVAWQNIYNEIRRSFEEETGLSEILRRGEGNTQFRSAAAANLSQQATMNRISSIQDAFKDYQVEIAKGELILSRAVYTSQVYTEQSRDGQKQYVIESSDIARHLGKEAGRQWGMLVSGEAVNPEFWMQDLLEQGVAPEEAANMAFQMAQQAISWDEWLRTSQPDIDAGPAAARDPQQVLEALRESMNQFVPTMIQSPDPRLQGIAIQTFAEYMRNVGLKEIAEKTKEVGMQYMQMPPMPAAAPPQEGVA